jgi:hypothetical protein
MNRAICGDNRFEIIEKAKQAILEETNIKDDKAQMAELDSFLFRCWQMGWLKKYEEKETNEGQALLYAVEKTAERTKREMIEKAVKWMYNYFVIDHYGMTNAGFGLFELAFKQAMQDESRRLDKGNG